MTLFTPLGRGLTLGEEGARIYELCQAFVGETDRFLEAVRERRERPRDVLRIGTFEVFSTYFIGELLERERFDGELLVRELLPGAMEAAVLEGTLDYAITYLPIPRRGLVFTRVGRVEMGIFGARRLAERPFAEWAFAAPPITVSGEPTGAKGLDGWPDHLVPRTVRYRVEMMETALDIARRGLGVAYLPTFVAALHNRSVRRSAQLSLLPRPPGLVSKARDIVLIRREGTDERAAERRLARALRAVTRLT